MTTPMTPMTATPPPMPVASNMRLSHIRSLLFPPILPPAHTARQQARDGKEHAIHNAKGKTRLLHSAFFLHRDADAVDTHAACGAADAEDLRPRGYGRAVLRCDSSELVDACDQCADEAEVNEGYEEGVGARAVVGEQCCNCPYAGEDADDEEDEDVVGGEQVLRGVDVHEVGKHS
ncbi:hypothetical protein B7494_g3229 [Chlorociboria aeruginascens]|nr:hypothetical protein B7494_g3229 [Chlorociboria aeruginascens]